MRNRPKRFGLNDYNLGDDGQLLRGSLEKNDGIEVAATWLPDQRRIGWVPSQVKMKLLGRNVRFALDWRLDEPAHRTLRKFYLATHMPETIPFGWVRRRRGFGSEAYEISPLWVALPELVREWWWNATMWLKVRAVEHGAAAIQSPSGRFGCRFVWWPAQDWGP